MIPRIELFKIAKAHIEAGAKFVRDERGIPVMYHEGRKCLIGLFIPMSTYFCSDKIEQMTLFEMKMDGILNEDEYRFLREMDTVNVLDEEEWPQAIKDKIDEYQGCNE